MKCAIRLKPQLLVLLILLLTIFFDCLDKTHLLAVPKVLNKLYQDEFGEVIIPCRPTTPDVNVTLKKDNQVVCCYCCFSF